MRTATIITDHLADPQHTVYVQLASLERLLLYKVVSTTITALKQQLGYTGSQAEPKVQAIASFAARGQVIAPLLLISHRIPFLFPVPVCKNISRALKQEECRRS